MKPRFRPRSQMHRHHRLSHPVCDRWHTKQTDPAAMRLGDLHRPYRRRKVRPRTHPIPNEVQVVPQISLELLHGLPIHARGTLVRRNPLVRFPDHQLGNVERLVLRLWHVHLRFLPGQPPRLIESTFLMSRPLRSTPTPASRRFTATTSRSASERRIGTQCLRFLPRHAPSRDPGPTAPARRIDARLLTFHTRAADQDHAASTPDTAWPIDGHPPSSILEGRTRTSISMPSKVFDASTATPVPDFPGRALLGRLPGPHLARSSRAFSLSLTTTVFSQRSTGRFGACPRRPTPEGQPSSISCTASPT